MTLPFQLLKKLFGLLLLPFKLLAKPLRILFKPFGILLKPFQRFLPKKKEKGEKKKFSLKDIRTMPKKKLILLLLLIILLAAAAVFGVMKVLEMLDKKESVEPEEPPVPVEIPLPVIPAPVAYEVVGESIFAFPVGDAIEVREERLDEEPEEEESAEKETGDTSEPETEQPAPNIGGLPLTEYVIYHYDFPESQMRVADYCELLTAEDIGFKAVDEKVMELEIESFEATAGDVHLVRKIPVEVDENGEPVGDTSSRLMSLRIHWDAKGVSVNVSELKGNIVVPPPPRPMTLTQAIDFMYESDPAKLGLSGESMAEYDIMPMDGAVLVGTTPCQRMNVYGKDPKTGTNIIAGQYLLSGDGRYLYRVGEDGTLEAIKR